MAGETGSGTKESEPHNDHNAAEVTPIIVEGRQQHQPLTRGKTWAADRRAPAAARAKAVKLWPNPVMALVGKRFKQEVNIFEGGKTGSSRTDLGAGAGLSAMVAEWQARATHWQSLESRQQQQHGGEEENPAHGGSIKVRRNWRMSMMSSESRRGKSVKS